MPIPPIGVLACNSFSSNSGTLTGLAAIQVLKEFGGERVEFCSLPALAQEVPRQVRIAKKLEHILIVDGCANACAQKTAEKLGWRPSAGLNLERDLQIQKHVPFSTLRYSEDDIPRVAEANREKLRLPEKSGSLVAPG